MAFLIAIFPYYYGIVSKSSETISKEKANRFWAQKKTELDNCLLNLNF